MKAKIYEFGESFTFSPSLFLATENLQNSILFRICIFSLFGKIEPVDFKIIIIYKK